ncbi:MAG TPA: hypothetical protein VGM17_05420 [Rhizomicrobium sp.]|jgi:hypothetical protein
MKRAILLAGAFALLGGGALAQTAGYPTAPQNQPMGSHAQPMGNQSIPGTTSPGSMSQSTNGANLQSLTQVSDVSTLNNASVQDQSGTPIGTVHKVVTGSSGKAASIQVDAQTSMGTKTVSIKASRLKYDPSRNILQTTLTKSEIDALPKASGT